MRRGGGKAELLAGDGRRRRRGLGWVEKTGSPSECGRLSFFLPKNRVGLLLLAKPIREKCL